MKNDIENLITEYENSVKYLSQEQKGSMTTNMLSVFGQIVIYKKIIKDLKLLIDTQDESYNTKS